MPRVPTLSRSEEWNQPRCWSLPSRYRSAGEPRSAFGSRTAAWETPESNQTSRMSISFSNSSLPQTGQAVPSGRSFAGVPLVPDVGTVLFEEVGHVVHDLRVGQGLAAGGAGKGGDRHPPGALAGDAPVGTVLDHAVDPLLAPAGNPLDLVDVLQRLFPEIVRLHADEPLLGGAEDDRLLAAPAVGVGVADLP